MKQRSLIFLGYDPNYKVTQQLLVRDAKFWINDITELIEITDDIQRQIAAIPTSGGFTAGQDLSGTNTSQTVIGLQTIPISATAPILNDILQFDGTNWTPTAPTSGGTVLTVAIATSNGFSGTSDGNAANPTLTLTTTVTGILKGNGTAISAATGDTDYQNPISLTTIGTSGAASFIADVLNIPQYQAAGTYVTSVSGTANRITSTGGTTPVIDIAATYVGQSSITTLGTLTTGATGAGFTVALTTSTITGTLTETHGGTNQTTYATGDLLYASAANTLSKLAATTNGFVLTLAAGIPSWAAPATAGTVTSVGTGTGLTGGTITSTGTISLNTKLAPADSLTGNALKVLRVNAGETAVEYATPTSGTVTTVSVTTANGVSGTVATATTTPAITLTLGAITPTTVNGITFSGSGSIANTGVSSLTAFTGSGTSSGTNTGDQTIGSLSPLTTKGDLFTFSTINTRLAVGTTDGQILGVSSAATTGLVWSTPAYPMARGGSGVIIRSDGTNNIYSTSTFADTYSINTLLYNASANTVSGLATANSGILITSAGGVPSIGTVIPNGVTATTQTSFSADAKVATDAYVNTQTFGTLVDYSGTSTIVGWSSFTTKTLDYSYCAGAKALFVNFYLIGTSNSISTSFTIPFNAAFTNAQFLCRVQNNSGTVVVSEGAITTGSNVLTFYATITAGTPTTWTAAGTKFIIGQCIIYVQ